MVPSRFGPDTGNLDSAPLLALLRAAILAGKQNTIEDPKEFP